LLFINIVRVVGAAVPFKRLFRFLAILADNIFDEIKVARWTAAIFRWASTFTTEKPRILCAGLGSAGLFDDDPMLPAVPKISRHAALGHMNDYDLETQSCGRD